MRVGFNLIASPGSSGQRRKRQMKKSHRYNEPLKDVMEKFFVKYYVDDKNPTIKGNGFDGLIIGEDREEANEFIDLVNGLIAELKEIKICENCGAFDQFYSDIFSEMCDYGSCRLDIYSHNDKNLNDTCGKFTTVEI